jgi:hypothetical protein
VERGWGRLEVKDDANVWDPHGSENRRGKGRFRGVSAQNHLLNILELLTNLKLPPKKLI